VGSFVGLPVGSGVGGIGVGANVGEVEASVGNRVGINVGDAVGAAVVGAKVGGRDGDGVGLNVGKPVGEVVGLDEGAGVGDAVGEDVSSHISAASACENCPAGQMSQDLRPSKAWNFPLGQLLHKWKEFFHFPLPQTTLLSLQVHLPNSHWLYPTEETLENHTKQQNSEWRRESSFN
jgi:hypothetical protein